MANIKLYSLRTCNGVLGIVTFVNENRICALCIARHMHLRFRSYEYYKALNLCVSLKCVPRNNRYKKQLLIKKIRILNKKRR